MGGSPFAIGSPPLLHCKPWLDILAIAHRPIFRVEGWGPTTPPLDVLDSDCLVYDYLEVTAVQVHKGLPLIQLS